MSDSRQESNEVIEHPSLVDDTEQRLEPCSRCGVMLPVFPIGCKIFHCPSCGNPYPFGDCSDI